MPARSMHADKPPAHREPFYRVGLLIVATGGLILLLFFLLSRAFVSIQPTKEFVIPNDRGPDPFPRTTQKGR